MSSGLTRRQFIATGSAAAAVALSTRPGFGRVVGANDRIRVASVGVGGRGGDLMTEFWKVCDEQNAEIVAVCDVWRVNREKAATRVKERWGKEPFSSSRYQEVVGRNDIDAVIIATPDVWHMPVAIAALKAGKDVYVEKPMAIKVDEANEALKLARKNDRVVQVGTQRRSFGSYRAAAKVYQTGVLGKVSRITGFASFNHSRWTRPTDDCKAVDVDWDAYTARFDRKRPFDAKLLREWQLYRACTNGLAGLWMTHFADLLHMMTGAKYPASAVAQGGVFVWKDGRETSDTFTAVLEYAEGFLFDWSMNLGVDCGSVSFNAYGTKGTLDVENQMLYGPGGLNGFKGNPESKKIEPEATDSHMGNWLTCVRSRQRPNADIQFGHQHAIATIMAAEALYSGRRQRWDAGKQRLVRD